MVEAYKYVFSQPGALTAPINYYRCMFKQKREKKAAPKAIETPTLVIWVSVDTMIELTLIGMTTYTLYLQGDSDAALNKDMADSHNIVATNVSVRYRFKCFFSCSSAH